MNPLLLKFDNGDWLDPMNVDGVTARANDRNDMGGAVCLVHLKNGHTCLHRYEDMRAAETARDSFAIEINEERAKTHAPAGEPA
jgi:hypothetical protein